MLGYVVNMVNYDKPIGISLLTLFLWFMAFIMIALSVYVFFYGSEFYYEGMLQGLRTKLYRTGAIIIFAVLILIAGIGLMKSALWGRGLLIGLSLLGIIQGIAVFGEDTTRGIMILIFSGFVIGYMFTSKVKDVFKEMDSRKALHAIDALDDYRKNRSLR
jgi:hypothetical protein